MDEIEAVRALRTDPAPAPETIARHRDQLLAAVASTGNGHVEDATAARSAPAGDIEVYDLGLGRAVVRSLQPRSRRRSWIVAAAAAVAAAAVAVLATGAVLATRDDTDLAAGPEEEATPAGELACGLEIPFASVLFAGYSGPVAGPIEPGVPIEAGSTGPDQLIQHWDSPTGQVELRWPARSVAPLEDPAMPPGDVPSGVEGENPTPSYGTSIRMDPENAPASADIAWAVVEAAPPPLAEAVIASAGYSGVVNSPQLGDGPCSQLRVTVTDASEDVAAARFNHIVAELEALTSSEPSDVATDLPPAPPTDPLVVARSVDPELPGIGECDVPEGEPPIPNVGGAVEGLGTFATAEDALAAFLPTKPTLYQDGYVQHDLADGTVGYARTTELGEVVTIVHAEPVEGGWTITRWQATGC